MQSTLEIRDTTSGLVICVSEQWRLGRLLMLLLFAGGFGYFFLRSNLNSRPLAYFFCALAAFALIRSIIGTIRGTQVELRVTDLDFISTGHAPEDYNPSVIARSEIYNIEFREATGGGEDSERPKGLYVEHNGGGLWNPSTCVLPNIDEGQTEEVMKAIYRRFPDMATLAPRGEFTSDLISLNLNKPDQG